MANKSTKMLLEREAVNHNWKKTFHDIQDKELKTENKGKKKEQRTESKGKFNVCKLCNKCLTL